MCVCVRERVFSGDALSRLRPELDPVVPATERVFKAHRLLVPAERRIERERERETDRQTERERERGETVFQGNVVGILPQLLELHAQKKSVLNGRKYFGQSKS